MTNSTPQAPKPCACWKHGLSAYANAHDTRYKIQCTQMYSARLDFDDANGSTFVACSSVKNAAENEAARLALLQVGPEACKTLRHRCGIDGLVTDTAANGDGNSSGSSIGQTRAGESTPGEDTASKRTARAW